MPEKGQKGFKKGDPSINRTGLNRGIRYAGHEFKRKIFELVNERSDELRRIKIKDLANLAGKIAPKELEVTNTEPIQVEINHNFIGNKEVKPESQSPVQPKTDESLGNTE